MKIVTCEQRSPEWFSARLGIPTASKIGKLITAQGKPRKGATRDAYLLELLAERLTRIPTHFSESGAMARGRELEPIARAYYAEHTNREIATVGFATDDSGRFGCSPDGVCAAENVGLEIKCPMLPAFMAYATSGEIPDDHFVQMQTCMMIFGFMAWDYLVYTDVRGLVPIVKRVEADVQFHAALFSALDGSCRELDAMERRMRGAGNGVPRDVPVDLSAIYELDKQAIAELDEIGSGEL